LSDRNKNTGTMYQSRHKKRTQKDNKLEGTTWRVDTGTEQGKNIPEIDWLHELFNMRQEPQWKLR